MSKKSIIILLLIVFVFTGTNLYAQLADSPWPMFMHDPQHTGRSEFKGPDYPMVKWVFELGNGSGLVIGHDGTIYAVGVYYQSEAYLYAINPDGTLKWKTELSGKYISSSSPVIASDGTIYFGLDDQNLYAVSSSGEKLWQFNTRDCNNLPPAVGSDGVIYASSAFGLYAINPDGTQKWLHECGSSIISTPAIDYNGNIYVCTTNDLISVKPDGSENWRFTSDGFNAFTSSPSIGADGTIYCGGKATGGGGNLYAVNPDGTEQWYTSVTDYINFAPAIGSDGSIYTTLGFTGSSHGYGLLYTYDSQGNCIWDYKNLDKINTPPLIDSQGNIYVGDYESFCSHNLFALYHDGYEKWRLMINIPISSLCLAEDGVMYARAGNIYAIGDSDKVQAALHIDPKSSCHGEDDQLKLLLDLNTPSESYNADIYLLMLGTYYRGIYFAPVWNEIPAPLFKNITLPPDVSLKDAAILDFVLPGNVIPGGSVGIYTFAFAAVKSGTMDFISNIALITFEYKGPS